MPRHEFRTIEEFILLLEEKAADAYKDAFSAPWASHEEGMFEGREEAFEEVLSILRSSNLGIVYPPSEDK